MKIIIAGGRNFNDYDYLVASCDSVISSIELKEGETIEIVCGLAAGADKMGEAYAESRGYPVKYFPAQWHFFGNSAGYKRNVQMAEYADGLIAFWDEFTVYNFSTPLTYSYESQFNILPT